ncbi:AAA family ATPase [Chryseobacterium sp. C3]|uniref:AAA family ATPase n=1 Tax=Chryseobacterium sp. C3 TaxID=2761532 RepID=UPI00162971BF|nr:AAA family ATPase [Chryseobacterium sp. C3]
MDIISKIEIKHFRLFDGGKDQEKVHIEELGDFNIFSGANDSGKSNVLRALNLFLIMKYRQYNFVKQYFIDPMALLLLWQLQRKMSEYLNLKS